MVLLNKDKNSYHNSRETLAIHGIAGDAGWWQYHCLIYDTLLEIRLTRLSSDFTMKLYKNVSYNKWNLDQI